MPFLQANGTGRDHNPDAICFLMGAGGKRGFSHGESDEFAFKGAVDKTSVYDCNATLLHLMDLDHKPEGAREASDQRAQASGEPISSKDKRGSTEGVPNGSKDALPRVT